MITKIDKQNLYKKLAEYLRGVDAFLLRTQVFYQWELMTKADILEITLLLSASDEYNILCKFEDPVKAYKILGDEIDQSTGDLFFSFKDPIVGLEDFKKYISKILIEVPVGDPDDSDTIQ